MKSLVSLAMNIAVVVAVAYLAYDKFNQPPPPSHSATPLHQGLAAETPPLPADTWEEVAKLRQLMARQQVEIDSLRGALAKNSQPIADPSVAATERSPRDPATIEASKNEWHAHMADVQADFFLERKDPKWSAMLTTTIRRVAENNDAIRNAIDNIECHSQTCRVELKDDGSGKANDQLPMFVQQMGGDLPYMQAQKTDDGHGNVKTVVYLSEATPGA